MSPPNFYMFIHLEFQTLNFIFFFYKHLYSLLQLHI